MKFFGRSDCEVAERRASTLRVQLLYGQVQDKSYADIAAGCMPLLDNVAGITQAFSILIS
jgi:hypothetical protein